jgi:hypothetical protein
MSTVAVVLDILGGCLLVVEVAVWCLRYYSEATGFSWDGSLPAQERQPADWILPKPPRRSFVSKYASFFGRVCLVLVAFGVQYPVSGNCRFFGFPFVDGAAERRVVNGRYGYYGDGESLTAFVGNLYVALLLPQLVIETRKRLRARSERRGELPSPEPPGT